MKIKINYEIKSYELQTADKNLTDISSPENVFNCLKDNFNPTQEEFYLLILDIKNKIIDKILISKGANNILYILPLDIIRPVILTNSNKIILAHNHPSGDCEPSEEDLKMTKKIKEACDLIGIVLLDHIIFSSEDYYSLKKGNLL